MSDLLEERMNLDSFNGLVACGGFSYGDVLGAGRGWALTILHHEKLKRLFQTFFHRKDTFTLGICNGCQMLSLLKDLIPGTSKWPLFKENLSGSHEARVCMVEITPSPSIFFQGMEYSCLPIAVSHGEGRITDTIREESVCMHYVDGNGNPTETYPSNPNGSLKGVTGCTTSDGRVTLLMPHPERGFRGVQHSWHPDHWEEDSPWMQMFYNARQWVDETVCVCQ